MPKFYETKNGLEIIKAKLKKLEQNLTDSIPEALATAAAFGDTSSHCFSLCSKNVL